MNPRQPIKTTAKKIGSVQKRIGKNPTKNVVDVRPYGGYTPLAHKTEAGSHIEQNYSVNVQNQMQLMKKIAQVSTLNTSHMHMQLGQLEKELKEWESKIAKSVKKKDRPLGVENSIVHVERTHQYLQKINKVDTMNRPVSISNQVQKIKATTGRFHWFGHTVLKDSSQVIEKVLEQYQLLHQKNQLSQASISTIDSNFFRGMERLESSLNSLMTKQWSERSDQLIESLSKQIEHLNQEVVTSKAFYRGLKKETNLSESALNQIRSYYKAKEKNSLFQWGEKEKNFVQQLTFISENIFNEALDKRLEKEYLNLLEAYDKDKQDPRQRDHESNSQGMAGSQAHMVSESVERELYKQLESYGKTFEQKDWVRSLVMTESPLIAHQLHKGVEAIYNYMVRNTNQEKNKQVTVSNIYDLLATLKTENINKQERSRSIEALLNSQLSIVSSNSSNVSIDSSMTDDLIEKVFLFKEIQEQLLSEETDELYQQLNLMNMSFEELSNSDQLKVFKRILTEGNHLMHKDESQIRAQSTIIGRQYSENRLENDIIAVENTNESSFIEKIDDNTELLHERRLIKGEILYDQRTSIDEIEKKLNISDHYKINLFKRFEEYHRTYDESLGKTFMWMNDLLSLKRTLLEETMEHIQLDLEKHVQDVFVSVPFDTELSEKVYQMNQADVWKRRAAFMTGTTNRWHQWFDQIAKTVGHMGLGVFKIKDAFDYKQLVYGSNLSKDEYFAQEFISLSQQLNDLVGLLRTLTTSIDEKDAYNHIEVKEKLNSLLKRIDYIKSYEAKHYLRMDTYDENLQKEDKQEFRASVISKTLESIRLLIGGSALIYSPMFIENLEEESKKVNKLIDHHFYKQEDVLMTSALVKETQLAQLTRKIEDQHQLRTLALNKLSGQMDVYYMPGGRLLEYGPVTMSYGEVMEIIESQALSRFTKLSHELKVNETKKNSHYIDHMAKHIHQGIERISQELQHMLGHTTKVLNQKQLLRISQSLLGQNGAEKASQVLIDYVERQYIKSLGLGESNSTINKLFKEVRSNNLIRKDLITSNPLMLQTVLKADPTKTHYNNIYDQSYRLIANKHAWSENLMSGIKVFGDYAYQHLDQVYRTLMTDQLSSNEIKNFESVLRTSQENILTHIYGETPSYFNPQQSGRSIYDGDQLHHHTQGIDNTRMIKQGDSGHQSSVYNETMIAYATEVVEASSDELSKELLSQKELIELIQSELAVLKEEKQVEQINLDRLSETLLKELTHKIRKDRQRKGWI